MVKLLIILSVLIVLLLLAGVGKSSTTISIDADFTNSGWARDADCSGTGAYHYNSSYLFYVGTSTIGAGREYASFFEFDTSAIPDSDTVDSATIYAYLDSRSTTAGDKAEVYQQYYGTFDDSDFEASPGTKEGTLWEYGDNLYTYHSIGVSASYINKTGVTQYSVRDNFACVDSFRRFASGDSDYNVFMNVTYSAAPADTCTPPASGDWTVDCSDECVLSDNTYLGGSMNLEGSGGNFTLNGVHLSMHDFNLTASPCTIYLKSGSTFNITSQT